MITVARNPIALLLYLTACVTTSVATSSATREEGLQTSPAASHFAKTCSTLAAVDFSGVEDAATQIMGAKLMGPHDGAAAYCLASGYVAPQVRFKIGLPASWNGKFIELGCGGHCGLLAEDDEFGTVSFMTCGAPLRRGYACVVSDMGHKGTGSDGLWAQGNLQAAVDWGYRATHVVALAGKAIVQSFYQKRATHAYFSGCSTGGRQALQEAQRFPWDFDGIIAGAPPIRLADVYVTFAWGERAAHDTNGKPLLSTQDLKLLTSGALARCDMDDGVQDGVISDPLRCPFRPSDLECKPGQTISCLTAEKAEAAERIYSGPVDEHGRSLFGAGAVPGSEIGGAWNAQYGGNWGLFYVGKDGAPPGLAPLAQDGLKFLFFSPPQPVAWSIRAFDFDKDYKRLDVMQSLYDSSNPDLSRFKAAGGRLLIYHGLNDLSILPQWIIRYYESVERVMGGREQTQSFVRLFSLPGVEHCGGGPGADTVDYLTALEDWVERGKAPERLIATHLRKGDWTHSILFPLDPSNVAFTRPAYPYPIRARYSGHGDPNDAGNFVPVAR